MLINSHSQKVNIWRFFVDMFVVCIAFSTAFFLRFDAGLISMPKGHSPFLLYFLLFPSLIGTYALTFWGTGVYERTLLRRRIWAEHFDILRTHLLAFLGFVTLTYFTFEHRYSRITLFLFFIITPLFIALGRSVIRKVDRAVLKKSKPHKRALVVGTGDVANYLASQIHKRREWDLELVKQIPAADCKQVGMELLNNNIDVVFIATSTKESAELQSIYDHIGKTISEIILIPDFGVPTFLSPRVFYLEQLPAVALNTSPLNGMGALQKRIFDICCSAGFIIVFSPVYLLCALLVRLTSKGPILYKQERMGIDGKVFNCLKFRGMYTDAEAKSGPVWATANDSRVTPVGKWLRKTSLDEIPQFFNVLKGEMSIVGPRPERPHFVHTFKHDIPGYMLRHKAKAGITGWAQINGWRGNTSLEKRIECDLWYLQNWSFWLDIKICLLTPIKGLVHPNAY